MNSCNLISDCVCRVTCQEMCWNFHRQYPSVKANYIISVKKPLFRALYLFDSFRFDFFTFGQSYGRLIRRKGLLIPFVSIALFFCRSYWLTESDLSNRKSAFHKLSTSSAASVRALVRPCTSSYRFFVLSALSAFALWSNLARQVFLASCNVGT